MESKVTHNPQTYLRGHRQKGTVIGMPEVMGATRVSPEMGVVVVLDIYKFDIHAKVATAKAVLAGVAGAEALRLGTQCHTEFGRALIDGDKDYMTLSANFVGTFDVDVMTKKNWTDA